MEHIFYSHGNSEKISWAVKTNGTVKAQDRTHVEIYKNKITESQSKYVALHVGLFWAIGVFIIKTEDKITVKLEDKSMFKNLELKFEADDDFIKTRIRFIKQLISQRNLEVQFELIEPKENLARRSSKDYFQIR